MNSNRRENCSLSRGGMDMITKKWHTGFSLENCSPVRLKENAEHVLAKQLRLNAKLK